MVKIENSFYAVEKLKRVDKEHLIGPLRRKVYVYELADGKEYLSYNRIPGVQADFAILHPLVMTGIKYGGTVVGGVAYLAGRLQK